jgi:hypothetical protein
VCGDGGGGVAGARKEMGGGAGWVGPVGRNGSDSREKITKEEKKIQVKQGFRKLYKVIWKEFGHGDGS